MLDCSKNKTPFLTVFTPNHNKSKFISETIESILNQTYSNFEYIIIDDYSNDDSWKIIQEYAKKDNRIKIYRNEKNLGITETRNKGFCLSSSRAKYFAIIDSDDAALPNRLELQIKFLENNLDYGLIGSNIIIINEDSQDIGYRSYPLTNKKIKKVITRYNPIAQSSVVLRKRVINEVGKYKKKWEMIEDYDYWLRVGISWKLANLEKPLVKYRLSKTQIKTTFFKKTLQKTYRLQNKANREYRYDDSVFNKIFRSILKIISIFPKFQFFLHRITLNNPYSYYRFLIIFFRH